MKTFIKYLITLVIIAILAGVFYKKVYIPKSTFTTIKPAVGELHVSIRGIGNVSALNIYAITAQTGGKILNILTDEGMWVKKGDLLVIMDGVDLPEQLEVAKASLLKAQYEVKALQSALKNQKVQKELLAVTYKRYKRLKEQKFAAQAEYDKAKADLQGIDATITATASQIDSAKASVVIASKNIDVIQAKIDRLKVYAPVDGYVTAKEAEVTQNVLPSTPILKIVDPKTLWVETKVDERISSQIKPMQKATIILRSQPNTKYEGIVKRVAAMSDAVTLEREIDVAFETIPKPFYINEQAEIQIDVKTYSDVLKIPLNVIVQKKGKLGIWIAKDKHAHYLNIEKIAQNDSEIAIANIDKNTQIIVPDSHKKPLSDGMKIH
jgi:RND family efflux transporter MFP subunit